MALVGVRLTAQLGDGFGALALHVIVEPAMGNADAKALKVLGLYIISARHDADQGL